MRPRNFLDLTGQTYGRLTVLAEAPSPRRWTVSWRCRCACGTILDVRSNSLRTGNTTSCGCQKRDSTVARNLKHGLKYRGSPAPEHYGIWTHIKDRCQNPDCKQYRDYGGRGITICAKWRDDYTAFAADIGQKPSPAHTLDRINNNGNYEPGNVRWATRRQQRLNARHALGFRTLDGEQIALGEIAQYLAIGLWTLRERFRCAGVLP